MTLFVSFYPVQTQWDIFKDEQGLKKKGLRKKKALI